MRMFLGSTLGEIVYPRRAFAALYTVAKGIWHQRDFPELLNARPFSRPYRASDAGALLTSWLMASPSGQIYSCELVH